MQEAGDRAISRFFARVAVRSQAPDAAPGVVVREFDAGEPLFFQLGVIAQPFVDSTTLEGQRRIRAYVLGWLERLDYAGKLDRSWPADELSNRIWARIVSEFAVVCESPIVNNAPLAEIIAQTMVEDYFTVYPQRRICRYAVSGPLPDTEFRRCVLDFIHDLEEFEPACLPQHPAAAAAVFWQELRERPDRWGYLAGRGPLIDDELRARVIALDAITEYYALRERIGLLAEEGSDA